MGNAVASVASNFAVQGLWAALALVEKPSIERRSEPFLFVGTPIKDVLDVVTRTA